MNISSVICEYNPFHNGHKLMLENMRKNGATHIIACMSGNFTQRGDFAIFDKWRRTETALLNGADLVIELPVSFACANAERFAFGGVYILNATGCTDTIFFGSECGDVSVLQKVCDAVTDNRISEHIAQFLSQGITFASAREKAVCSLYDKETSDILAQPNNILAVEYLKAIKKLNSKIVPSTVKRIGTNHDSKDTFNDIASASLIRKLIYENDDEYMKYIPENISKLIRKESSLLPDGTRIEHLESAVIYRLRTMTEQDFALLPDISEGLENRFISAVKNSVSYNEIVSSVKCKRYTHARIRRCIISAFLQITQNNCPTFPPYIRILGFNNRGRDILRIMRKTADLPIIMRYADVKNLSEDCKHTFDFESKCDDIYALSGKEIYKCGKNYTGNIVIL